MTTSEPSDQDHNITAFFDSREAAEQAIGHLVEAGLPRDKILLRIGAARKAAEPPDGKSMMQEVKELVLPAETSDAACEAIRQEGFVLTLRPDDERHDAILDMLRSDGGRGVESREDIWPAWKSDPAESGADPLVAEAEDLTEPDPEPEEEDSEAPASDSRLDIKAVPPATPPRVESIHDSERPA